MPQDPHFETIAIRHQRPRSAEREHSVPLFLTSSFVFDSAEQARALFADEITGNIYSRYSNPNVDELVSKVCRLEGAEDGIGCASGMGAVFTSMASLLKSGDHVVACRSLFGSTVQILNKIFPKWGIESTYVDIGQPEQWVAAFRPNTRLVFVETPSNPGLDLIDLAWIAKLTHERGAILVVDNCFATPYLQQPIPLGADLVVHSATKYLDGQGRALAGLIVGRRDLLTEIRFFARQTGPALAPFNAWLISKSLETLAVRMDRHCENALAVAEHFVGHPELKEVRYPFLPSHPQYELARRQMKQGGGNVVLVVRGGIERGRRFLDSVVMSSHTPNLGDTRTIVTHPTSTTHSKLTEEERLQVGIVPGLVRVSVGLEHVSDIIADIEGALERSR